MTMNEQQQRLEALLQPPPLGASIFPPPSRYAGIETAVWNADGERPVIHLRRRFVPRPEALDVIGQHTVVDGERPDTIAASALGDAQLFWRLCDANRETFAVDLVREAGRRLRVTAPEVLSDVDGTGS
jgi:hypothetical protein